MQFSDEEVMAFADGELDEAQAALLRQALPGDPQLAARVRRQQALRTRLQQAFGPELAEPVPARLQDAVNRPAGPVVNLGAVRADRTARAAWSWVHWGGMAASVALGVLVGRLMLPGDGAALWAQEAGGLVARGALAQALSRQLASTPEAGGEVAVQLSFLARTGEYCRSFSLKTSGTAGLACRGGEDWQLRLLAPGAPEVQATPGAMRQAASSLPAAVLREVDARIQGDPLDATAEKAAQARAWRP